MTQLLFNKRSSSLSSLKQNAIKYQIIKTVQVSLQDSLTMLSSKYLIRVKLGISDI